jgi:hypothetical protein
LERIMPKTFSISVFHWDESVMAPGREFNQRMNGTRR